MAKLPFYSFIFLLIFHYTLVLSHSEIHSILRKENIIFVVFLILLLKWCVTEAVLARSGNGTLYCCQIEVHTGDIIILQIKLHVRPKVEENKITKS